MDIGLTRVKLVQYSVGADFAFTHVLGSTLASACFCDHRRPFLRTLDIVLDLAGYSNLI